MNMTNKKDVFKKLSQMTDIEKLKIDAMYCRECETVNELNALKCNTCGNTNLQGIDMR